MQTTTNLTDEQQKTQDKENRASFLKRLDGLPEETVMLIDFAYDLGKEAHRPQKREGGERYFEHLRGAALILIDECKIKDPDLIITLLLHDSIEDSAMFGNVRQQTFSKWKETARFRLGRIFNSQVAEMVIALTKPEADGVELKTKEEARRLYLENLAASLPKIILAKMMDRLHNLRSLPTASPETKIETVTETKEIYFALFQKVLTEYPIEGKYMLDEMKKAIAKLEV